MDPNKGPTGMDESHQARFHRALVKILPKKLQGYVMGAFRESQPTFTETSDEARLRLILEVERFAELLRQGAPVLGGGIMIDDKGGVMSIQSNLLIRSDSDE